MFHFKRVVYYQHNDNNLDVEILANADFSLNERLDFNKCFSKIHLNQQNSVTIKQKISETYGPSPPLFYTAERQFPQLTNNTYVL